ncbi:MAG: hypothetical protein LBR22_09160 [Desulfovibrio sp.]|jgi:hypothetical protein|nr:hypothetical protein [Desulfovibrio sp.]
MKVFAIKVTWFPNEVDHARELEQFNFKSIRDFTYGDVRVSGINITRLSAEPNDDYIKGVTVIFMANRSHDDDITVKVSWYDNATVYRKQQYRTDEISHFTKN